MITPTLTVGSLFAGMGGFDVGFESAGLCVVWQVEKDVDARRVLRHHYPDAQLFDDVCTVGKGNLAPVDVICGGFPCQGFSVAGKRGGLEDVRSCLFFEMARVVDELRPRLLIWENVPGLLSGREDAEDGDDDICDPDGGRDVCQPAEESIRAYWMGTVIGELARIGYFGAWTSFDSQWFGLAQRRRRLFGVFAPGSAGAKLAAEILAFSARGQWHPETGGEARTRVAARASAGSGGDSGRTVTHAHKGVGFDASEDGTGRGTPLVVEVYQGIGSGSFRAGTGPLAASDDNGSNQLVMAIQDGRGIQKRQNGLGISDSGEAYTVDTTGSHAVAYSETGPGWLSEGIGTLRAEGENRPSRPTHTVVSGMIVRRLLPVECLRLQGFADDWLDLVPTLSDSAKYRLCGNAVSVPVARWLGKRIRLILEGEHP